MTLFFDLVSVFVLLLVYVRVVRHIFQNFAYGAIQKSAQVVYRNGGDWFVVLQSVNQASAYAKLVY